MNTRRSRSLLRHLEREGFERLEFGMVIPPNGTLDLPARDARRRGAVPRGAELPRRRRPRKFATVRHAGEMHGRRGLVEELNLSRLPLVPKLLRLGEDDAATTVAARADSD
jgi:hypothetical protein